MTHHAKRRTSTNAKAYTFNFSCEQKRLFINEADALAAADIGMLENMQLTLRVYHCPICSYWHLTSSDIDTQP